MEKNAIISKFLKNNYNYISEDLFEILENLKETNMEELIKSFKNHDDDSIYFEQFIYKCYEVKIMLDRMMNKNFKDKYVIIENTHSKKDVELLSEAFNFYTSFSLIADYCNNIGIDSYSKTFSDYFIASYESLDKLLNTILLYMDFYPTAFYNNKIKELVNSINKYKAKENKKNEKYFLNNLKYAYSVGEFQLLLECIVDFYVVSADTDRIIDEKYQLFIVEIMEEVEKSYLPEDKKLKIENMYQEYCNNMFKSEEVYQRLLGNNII